MVKFNQLSHQLPEQPPLGERVRKAGYNWSGVAENIAKGQQTPEQVMSSWMNSPGHRANLLAPQYQHLGVGYANRFWTQVFGRPA
ncbi:CAP domain-containing protein [Phormidesmis sp. 146-35]